MARSMATAVRWPVGVALTSWRYMWRTTPIHRSEEPGSWPEDAPPPVPDGLLDEQVQLLRHGAGPLFRRRYLAHVRSPRMPPEELMAHLQRNPDRAAPSEFATFKKATGNEGGMRPGDEYVVRMPGPWDGPVRVVEVSPSSFGLATLVGHLEAGQIAFRTKGGRDRLEFEIESWPPFLLSWSLFLDLPLRTPTLSPPPENPCYFALRQPPRPPPPFPLPRPPPPRPGSIYHRFGSRDALLTRLWIRAVRRSQASFLAALEEKDARAAALGAALSVFDFCAQEPGEARLLLSFRREDLIPKLPAKGPPAEELRELNRPIERAIADLARRLTGRRTRRVLEGTLLAVFDLPYGAVRRHLIAGQPPPPRLRADLTLAVSAVIEQLATEASAQRPSEGDPSDP